MELAHVGQFITASQISVKLDRKFSTQVYDFGQIRTRVDQWQGIIGPRVCANLNFFIPPANKILRGGGI